LCILGSHSVADCAAEPRIFASSSIAEAEAGLSVDGEGDCARMGSQVYSDLAQSREDAKLASSIELFDLLLF
jgi:hypothetical protein